VFERRLVTLQHEGGVAAVVVDRRGRAWLGDPEPGTMLDGFEPGVQGLAADVTLAGGRLPAGAVAAVVSDRAGQQHEATCATGAWLALLPEPIRGETPLVRFLDAAGELVAVPLPDGVKLERVSDATDRCPVCEACDWGRVVAAPRGRYGEDGAGRPTAAVCRRCGHVEALGVLYSPLSADAPTPADVVELEARVAREMTAAARSARFVLYGLVGHEPTVAGHGRHGAELDSVTLGFDTPAGRVDVQTSADQPWQTPTGLARQALEGRLHERDPDWPQGSETATLLWLNGRHRSRAKDAAAAPAREIALSVDGKPRWFTTVAHGQSFAAVARLDKLTVTITGHGEPAAHALTTLGPSAL
jgi:hypothetical protein